MNEDRFEAAARAYLAYGVVYWLGGAWLAWNGIGTRAGRAVVWQGVAWVAVGLALVLVIPYLLRERRRWFERWLLSRRDFARILAVFIGLRALAVLRVAVRSETASVAAPWGGVVTFRMGATVFFLVTVVALVFVARAAWWEPAPGERAPGRSTPGRPGESEPPPSRTAHPRPDPGTRPPLP